MATIISGIDGVDKAKLTAIKPPLFSAYQSTAQSFTADGSVKVLFQTEVIDTDNTYDPTLSRFTPNIAGWYQVNSMVRGGGSATRIMMYIRKNGTDSVALDYKFVPSASFSSSSLICSTIVYMNGTTDYLEVIANPNTTMTSTAGEGSTFFNGVLVRAE